MSLRILLLLALASGVLAPNAARAQSATGSDAGCRLVIEAGPEIWLIPYEPFSQSEAVREFDIPVVNRGEAPCAAQARLDLAGEPYGLTRAGSPERLSYALIDARGGRDLTPRSGRSFARSEGQPVSLAGGERGLLRFSLTVAPSDLLAGGIYSQNAILSLETSDGVVMAQKPLMLGVEVISAAVMGVKGQVQRVRGLATIDLGALAEGPRDLATTLYVLSTGGYAVSVSSANNGHLRQGATDWSVPYTLTLGGRALDLVRGDRLEVVSGRARVDDYPLKVVVGQVSGRRAGDYSDVITFTVAAI